MPGSWKVWSTPLLLFAVLSPSLPAQEPANFISLNSRVIDTSRPEAAITETVDEALLVRPEDAIEDEIVLVKFPGPVTARQVKALKAESLRVYAYLPYYAYLVKMPVGKAKASLSKMGASWSGPYHPAYKISPAIAEVVAGDFSPAAIEAAQGVGDRLDALELRPTGIDDAGIERDDGGRPRFEAQRLLGRQRGGEDGEQQQRHTPDLPGARHLIPPLRERIENSVVPCQEKVPLPIGGEPRGDEVSAAAVRARRNPAA